jgi:hypothetical protein
MAKAIHLKITATGTYVFPVDYLQTPFSVGYMLELASGATISFVVNYTLANLQDTTWTAVYLADPTNGTTKTTSVAGSYTTPITALEFVVSAISGSAQIDVLQGISPI